MTITVNGSEQVVEAETLALLIAALGLEGTAVATAVNGHFVAKAKRAGAVLRAGDRIEILSPMQGG